MAAITASRSVSLTPSISVRASVYDRTVFFFFQAEDGIRDVAVTGVQTCALPILVDAPSGKGHVVLFSINPVYRGETWGSYAMVLNTILNFDSLNAGRRDPSE